MDVLDDTVYVEKLATLSEGSVRRNFNPYTDIAWDSPEFAVVPNDPRWILPDTDPLGGHPWYQAQSQERQIEIGMWRQANVAKVGLHFENILIRGLMEYAFWVPNGSPEFRYCTHEAIEEGNHTLMFQEMVNHMGVDVPGMPKLLKWIQPLIPLAAGPAPIPFFFGVLAGEEPIDHTQKNILREGTELHPIMERVMAIHVAEEARHISFAHEYLHKRAGADPLEEVLAVAVRPGHHAHPVLGDRRAAARLLEEVRHPEVGPQRAVLRRSRVAHVPAEHVLRRPHAVVRHRSDEPAGQDHVEDLQDRRPAEPVPQRAAASARRGRRLNI